MTNKTRTWLVLLVIGIALVPIVLAINPVFSLSHDAATYAILGENLAAGNGYTYQGYAHVKYPPGYPLLLGGMVSILGKDMLVWNIFSALLAVLSLLAAWRFVAGREGEGVGLAVTLAVGFTGFFISHSAYTLTDIPFLGLVCMACISGRLFLAEPTWRRAFLLGLLIVLAASFRMVGLLLLPALLAAWFTAPGKKRYGKLPCLALPLLLGAGMLLLWLIYKGTATPLISEDLRDGATYMGELQGGLWLDAPQGILATLWHQMKIRPVILCGTCARFLSGERLGLPGAGGWAGQISLFSITATAFVLLAVLRSCWRNRGLMDWFFLIYFGVLMVTPAFVGPRYFIPILPYLLASLFCVVRDFFGMLGAQKRKGVYVFAALLVYLLVWIPTVIELVKAQPGEGYYQGDEASFVQASRALAGDQGQVTVCNEAALAHFFSRTRTTGFPLTNVDDVAEWILTQGDRVLLSTWGYPVHENLLRQAAGLLVTRGKLIPEKCFGTVGPDYLLKFFSGDRQPRTILFRVKK